MRTIPKKVGKGISPPQGTILSQTFYCSVLSQTSSYSSGVREHQSNVTCFDLIRSHQKCIMAHQLWSVSKTKAEQEENDDFKTQFKVRNSVDRSRNSASQNTFDPRNCILAKYMTILSIESTK